MAFAAYCGGNRATLSLSGSEYLNRETVDKALEELYAKHVYGLEQPSKAERVLLTLLESYIPIWMENRGNG